jgi:TolA protein
MAKDAETEEEEPSPGQDEGMEAQVDSEDGQRLLEEWERYRSLIRQTVQDNWYIPPGSDESQVVTLSLTLLPTGEVGSVSIVEGSGNQALDDSALRAVRRVANFPVPDDGAVFNQYFRGGLTMEFSPKE